MPTTPSPNEATFKKFFDALDSLAWDDMLDCVANDFRGTISKTQKNLRFQQYKEEMERVRNALEVTNVSAPAITVHRDGNKITAVYTVYTKFVNDLQPPRSSHGTSPMKANGKPVIFDVREVYTFNDQAKITTLVSESRNEKIIGQMSA